MDANNGQLHPTISPTNKQTHTHTTHTHTQHTHMHHTHARTHTHTHTHTRMCVSVNCGDFHRLLLFYLTKQYILSPNPTLTLNLPLIETCCIVTLSDKHHLLFYIFFPFVDRRPVPTMSKISGLTILVGIKCVA